MCGDAFVTLPWFVLAWEFSLIVSISEKVCKCGSGFVCMCCYVSLWEWICGYEGSLPRFVLDWEYSYCLILDCVAVRT